METNKNTTEIFWKEINDRQYLYFSFCDHFSVNNVKETIEKWEDCMNSQENSQKMILIWDCLKLKKYDSEARILWQNHMKLMKPFVSHVWLLSDSRLVKSGSSLLSMFSGYTIKNIERISQITDM